ncbi:sigma-70 factor domain-containing protein, partial [Vibrio cholerae]|uniref:sigma-70 factor domain-containing protein n=1 Tax=Vibrio cholerae TaxID=666 RepID=UPI003075C155
MSQSTLRVDELYTDEIEENMEEFDEVAAKETENESDAQDEIELIEGVNQRALDATQLYLGEIGYSPLLTAEEEVFFARRALRGEIPSRQRMTESNKLLVF